MLQNCAFFFKKNPFLKKKERDYSHWNVKLCHCNFDAKRRPQEATVATQRWWWPLAMLKCCPPPLNPTAHVCVHSWRTWRKEQIDGHLFYGASCLCCCCKMETMIFHEEKLPSAAATMALWMGLTLGQGQCFRIMWALRLGRNGLLTQCAQAQQMQTETIILCGLNSNLITVGWSPSW